MKLTSAMIRSALIKGTGLAAAIVVVVLVFNNGERPEGLSWFEMGVYAWLISCGLFLLFLLPGSRVEDGNGGGNGGNGNGGDD